MKRPLYFKHIVKYIAATVLISSFSTYAFSQEIGISGAYKLTNNQFNQVTELAFWGAFHVQDRIKLKPCIAYNHFFFNSRETFQGPHGSQMMLEKSGGKRSLMLGLTGLYAVFSPEKKLNLLIGTGINHYVFGEAVSLNEIAPYSRWELGLPFTLEYQKINDSNLGAFFSVIPGKIFASEKHQAINPVFGGNIYLISFQIGTFIEIGGE